MVTIRIRVKSTRAVNTSILNLLTISHRWSQGFYETHSEVIEEIEKDFVIQSGDVENWNLLDRRIAIIPTFRRDIFDLVAV